MENCQQFAHKLFWNVSTWLALVRPDILWSVNKLARAVTKWTKLVTNAWRDWFLTFITQVNTMQYCSVGNTAQSMQIRIVSRFWFCRRPWRLKHQHQVDSYAFSEAKHLCQEVGCARNRPQFHTVQQKLRVISLDAVLCIDGIPALDLWDVVIEVFHSSPNQANKARDLAELQGNLLQSTTLNMRSQIPTKHINLDLTDVDHVPLKTFRFQCYVVCLWGQMKP